MTQTISSRERVSPQLKISSDLTSTQRQNDEVKVNTNSSRATIQPQVQLTATGMQVVHATNGRIRIKATDGSFNSNVKKITQHLRQYQGVKEVAANEQTGSMVVTFDENKLSLRQMLRILRQFNIRPSQNTPLSDPFAPWKSADFWKEQTVSFIPLMTGLAVTGGLGISGLAAIPVYMITTDATRSVIDYLKPQISGTEAVKEAPKTVVKIEEHRKATTENKPVNHQKNIGTATQSEKLTYAVVHEIPGRIRFNLPLIASDRAYVKRLERLLKADPLVTNVRINTDAASLAISYKPSKVAVSYWVNLLESALHINPVTVPNTRIEPQTSLSLVTETVETTSSVSEPETVTQITASADETTPTFEGQSLDISSLWADMKPSALTYSLDLIANLPL
ncbi:HMA2 domain-containing protein [Nostoc sp. TCL26-01]|uniref:HMA2 domain-containing protein n=1 Tax=Nostoc sp. TCL26-01 TaxID=2576904 RepID=UPI0015B89B2A|nr:hypothetical protein [Nostoc sp. TCL26-01]QLE55644.1 hypothetical protein FD725_09020 [Nostoc sp. TCL26-01]